MGRHGNTKGKHGSAGSDMFISYLTCPECGLMFPIPRFNSNRRKKGHIKDLYCPKCGTVQKMVEEQ